MSEVLETVETAQDATIEALESQETREGMPRWHRQVAFSTLVMALLAAVGGMLAGISSQEALDARTREIIEMNYLEADRLHVEMLKSKHEILIAMGEDPDPEEADLIAQDGDELEEMEDGVVQEEDYAMTTTNAHVIFAISVTLLSLGITLGGMAVVVERRYLWISGLVVGVVGAFGVIAGVIVMLSQVE